MRLMDFSQFESIFVNEFDPEVFLLIIDTFTTMVIENENFNNSEEQIFICRFLNCIATQTPRFDFTLDFMEEKDLAKIKNVISKLDKVEGEQ